jgi:HlyD family secretion protein
MDTIKKSTFIQKTRTLILAHKVWSALIIIALIAGGYALFHKKTPTETRYVTTQATTGTVVVSVTGSGQVAASNQIDLKPKVSGNVTYVGVNAGDLVKQGKLLFSIDSTDAQKAVRDAQSNLTSAKLALEKLQEPPTDLSIIQTKDAIAQATADKANQASTVSSAYTALLNLTPEAVPNGTDTTVNYTAPTISGNYTLNKEGEIDLTVYNTGSDSGYFNMSGLVSGVGNFSSVIPQPIGNSGLFIKFSTGSQAIMNWVISIPNKNANGYLSTYNSYQSALQNSQKAITDDEQSITENTEKLAELQAGTDPLQIQTQQLAITQAQNALTDAQQTLSDYSIYAPFDGVMASVDAQVGQPGDTGTALGTIITNQDLAEVTLNEVDVSKIKVGDKATLTFDAIPNLSIAGQVASIDAVGTVTQGVVDYTIKIAFATDNNQIKPGMSVSAAIVTDLAQDVLTVPNSAVKTINGASYVSVFNPPLAGSDTSTGAVSAVAPQQVPVQVGLSNDTLTQITSGLKEGDQVVSRTITTAVTTNTTSSAPSLLGGGATRAIGGATRGGATFRSGTGG